MLRGLTLALRARRFSNVGDVAIAGGGSLHHFEGRLELEVILGGVIHCIAEQPLLKEVTSPTEWTGFQLRIVRAT